MNDVIKDIIDDNEFKNYQNTERVKNSTKKVNFRKSAENISNKHYKKKKIIKKKKLKPKIQNNID